MKTKGPNPNPIEPARSKRHLSLSTKNQQIIENTSILATIFHYFGYLFRACCPEVAKGVQGPTPKCYKDPKMAPRGAQMDPKGAQMASKLHPNGAQGAQMHPRVPKGCPNGTPGSPNGAPRSPKVLKRYQQPSQSDSMTPNCVARGTKHNKTQIHTNNQTSK